MAFTLFPTFAPPATARLPGANIGIVAREAKEIIKAH
jgi:hypothetical protein